MQKRYGTKRRLIVSGNPFFLSRHQQLIDALRLHIDRVDEVAVAERATLLKIIFLLRYLASGRLWPPTRDRLRRTLLRFYKTPATFVRLSKLSAKTLAQHGGAGTFDLQLFSMFAPVTDPKDRLYAHYVDMTMALVRRHWPEWAPFDSEAQYAQWIALEGASYRGAARVFTFAEVTRQSMIADYGVDARRVVTVGAAGHYRRASTAPRTYGNRTIIFNGSDFMRKGGDRVVAAFRIVRKQFPDATLTIVACGEALSEPGIVILGKVSREQLYARFNMTDLVLAPTRLDVLPGFVLEAMSCGVVPVLSDAESMHEMIVDGNEGYVVSPPTPECLAVKISHLFADASLLERFGKASRARIERDWNWTRVAERMISSLNEDGLP